MNFNWLGLVIIVVVAGFYVLLWFLGKKVSFMWHMLIALGLGLAVGVAIQLIWPMAQRRPDGPVAFATEWLDIIRNGYANLLKLMVVPLVLVAIISGVLQATDSSAKGNKIGKGAGIAIATLLITCGIAAFISVATSVIFHLDAKPFMEVSSSMQSSASLSDTIFSIFSADNIFAAISQNQILPVMFLSLIFAIIIAGLKKDEDTAEAGTKLQNAVNVLYEFVMGLVDVVIGLAPYGIFAFILNFGMNTAFIDYTKLLMFVVASYVAMLVMWAVHMIIMLVCGVTPMRFFKKCGKSILMGFTTRSSMATLPTTIKCMEELGVEPTLATFAGTFSTCVGQNGCGGTYPAMVATMVYTAIGTNLFAEPGKLIVLIFIVMLCSLGIAGVGGGATAAGLMIFGVLNWSAHVGVIVSLFSVEALIDMGRTALNISGGHVAAIVSGRLSGSLDLSQKKAEAKV